MLPFNESAEPQIYAD